MKSLLLYNLYPKNNWREVTNMILANPVYHDEVYVNITLDKKDRFFKYHKIVNRYLRRFNKITKIIYTINNPLLGEVAGFDNFRKVIDYNKWDIITYTHSKGVTKPKNLNIKDWVAMMKYFVIDRHDLCIEAFKNGYSLYGANLNEYKYNRVRQKTYKYCDFWYGGTFVSVNLQKVKKQFLSTNCTENYYGVEAFWGNLCPIEEAYCVHKSPYSLYDYPYPPEKYVME